MKDSRKLLDNDRFVKRERDVVSYHEVQNYITNILFAAVRQKMKGKRG